MPDFVDTSALLAGNPYLSLPTVEKPHWTQTIGTMLANLGAGISGATAAGLPWGAGIAPGASLATMALARQEKEQEADALRRFQLGLSLQGLRDKQDEKRLQREGLQAWANANDPSKSPGIDLKPSPYDMAPRPDLKTAGAPLVDYLVQKHGLSPVAAATVIGNLGWESPGFNTNQVHDGGRGYGLAGWDPQRTAGLQAFAAKAGKPASDMQTQLDYVVNEMKGGDMGAQRAYAMLQGAKTPEEATTAMMHFFRPAGYTPADPTAGHGYQGRVANARALIPAMGEPPPSMVAQGANAAPMPSVTPQQVGAVAGNPAPMPQQRMAGVIPQGAGDTPDIMTQPTPAPGVVQTPAPMRAPPPEPPQVPRPMLSRADAAELAQLARTPGMTVEKLEAEKQKRINELWKSKQDQANKTWQMQWDNYKTDRAEANKTDAWQTLSEAEARGVLGNAYDPNKAYQRNKTGQVKPIGESLVTIDQKGQSAFAKKVGEHDAERLKTFQDNEERLRDVATKVGMATDLLRNTYTGPAGGWANEFFRVLGGMGVESAKDKANAAAGATAVINQLMPYMRAPGSGATSDYEMRTFAASLPALTTLPGGNELISAYFERMADRASKIRALAEQHATQSTGLTGSKFAEEVKALGPLFDKKEIEQMQALAKGTKPEAAPDPKKVNTIREKYGLMSAPEEGVPAPAPAPNLKQKYGLE